MFHDPLFFAVFWLLFAIAIALFLRRAYRLFCWIRLGAYENAFDHVGKRLTLMLGQVLPQICSLKSVSRKDLSGLGHALLFWAFIVFVFNYLIYLFIGEGFGLSETIIHGSLSRYYFLISDIAGVMALLAVIWAAVRRYVIRPERLESTAEAAIILVIVFSLIMTHFCAEGFHINAMPDSLAVWTPIGLIFATLFHWVGLGAKTQELLYWVTWWVHYLVLLGFLVFIPYSKHLHIIAASLNIFFSSLRPRGALLSVDLDKIETYGVSRIEQYTWKQLLDLYACAQCGRCRVNCPAYRAGKPLNPQQIILDLRKSLLNRGPSLLESKPALKTDPGDPALIGGVVTEDAIWACTTCGSCLVHCPTFNDPLTKITEIRRHLVLEKAAFPSELKAFFRNIESNGNPLPKASVSRGDWAIGLNISKPPEDGGSGILYWVGCLGSYDERVQRVSQSLTRVLKAMGIKIWILGKDEQCCGDSVRRLGNEYLFQKLAKENIAVLKKHDIKKIVTFCPHCFNTLKNEYPQFGGDFEVMHHVQLLDDLIQKKGLNFEGRNTNLNVAYHDPCYLGRYNGIYEPPRNILKSLASVTISEVSFSREKSFCCGAGGGKMWMRERSGSRINQVSFEEIMRGKPDILATACPYCLMMLEDASKSAGTAASLQIMDVVELIGNSL